VALSTVVKNMRDGSLTIKDGTGTPLSITVQFDTGDFSITGLKAKLAETTAYETRGQLRTVRHTTRIYPTGSFTAYMAEFSENSVGTLADAILKNGTVWSAAISTDAGGANADVYLVDLEFTCEGTDYGDSSDHIFGMTKCECVIDFSENDPNSFSVAFTCYGALTGGLATTE